MIDRGSTKIITMKTDKQGFTTPVANKFALYAEPPNESILNLPPNAVLPVIIGPPVPDNMHLATEQERECLPEGSHVLVGCWEAWVESRQCGYPAAKNHLYACPDAPERWWFRTDLVPEAYAKGQRQWFLSHAANIPAGMGHWIQITDTEAEYLQNMPDEAAALRGPKAGERYYHMSDRSWVPATDNWYQHEKTMLGRRWIRRETPTIRVKGGVVSYDLLHIPDGEYRLVETAPNASLEARASTTNNGGSGNE